MNKKNIVCKSFEFDGGVSEYQIMIRPDNPRDTFIGQMRQVTEAVEELLRSDLKHATPVFGRIFLSDIANQQEELAGWLQKQSYALSVIEQPPLDGSKIVLWLYCQTEVQVEHEAENLYVVRHGAYQHYWKANAAIEGGDSDGQTYSLLSTYTNQLQERQLSLLHNCVRTWFFVQNVDVNYAGVVTGRNRLFDEQGLTVQTHFIASTGIGGRTSSSKQLVSMDAYAVKGIEEGQMGYLYASDYMNPTAEYGVSFERASYVDYGDRRHIFISGTASIDNQGQVVHPKDIENQVYRMWQNVEALLQEAGTGFEQVGSFLVYLRDLADYSLVDTLFRNRFPDTPYVILLAPVCRPGWLIEMECMAIVNRTDARYLPY